MGLPWIGFAFGCTLARLTRRPTADVIAIAIETGVQNTGMSIFILWFTLDQPLGDMTGLFYLLQYIWLCQLLYMKDKNILPTLNSCNIQQVTICSGI